MIVDTTDPVVWEHTDVEPERLPWWRGWPPAVVVLVLAAIAIGGLTVALAGDATAQAPGLTHQRWTEPDGRVCTAATVGESVALQCAFRPAESRLGSLLDGPGQ